MKTIKTFILTASVVVSILFFGGTYLLVSNIFDHSIKTSALHNSNVLAQSTFNSMFQLMSTGWTRAQLESFISANRGAMADSAFSLEIYRGKVVEDRFGPIAQGAMDAPIEAVFRSGASAQEESKTGVRYIFPLKAEAKCLQCHVNAQVGNVLGVIDVRQDLSPVLQKARDDFFYSLVLIAPIPFVVAFLVTVFVNRRIDDSIEVLEESVEKINKVSDLRHMELRQVDLGFAELNSIFHRVEDLVAKLKSVAVDKDLLEFEIKLLEKFVITSEVVKDWREYISRLLVDINQVIDAYTLFSIFKVDDELFDLEVFWRSPPSDATKAMLEKTIRRSMREHPNFASVPSILINHHVADSGGPLISLTESDVEVQVKSLLVETPKIGGIVGIGVQADIVKDETRLLVMDSVLSTLLNVVGSVKAIYKYTRDLEYYATRDPLTDLYNQRVFWELLGYEIGRADRHDYKFSLLVIDLDNFKLVNDSYGHAFGDKFLEAFADAVKRVLRTGDVLARYGGDEFVVILPEADLDEADSVAGRILEESHHLALLAPDGGAVKASASIGMAVFPDHAKEPKDLFLFADNMMYKAKADGKGRVGVPTEEDVVEVFRSISEKSIIILNAVEQKKVVPYFQPIMSAKGRRIEAVEVLSRIQLDGEEIMGAAEFVEIAEKMGVIHKLDYLVMEKALQEIHAQGFPGLVFINLSPRALVLSEFIPEVRRIVTASGIEPERIVFEITERDTVKNISLLEKFVNELKLEGYQLAIDDFGSGFSSFHYLKRFPIDFLKIEGDFIVNMLSDGKDRAFVHSIASLAQELGIRTVAEFVENPEVLEQVVAAGIDFAQGYYIGRPSQAPLCDLDWSPSPAS